MRFARFLFIIGLALRYRLHHGSTSPEDGQPGVALCQSLQYQQVLDNLAHVHGQPGRTAVACEPERGGHPRSRIRSLAGRSLTWVRPRRPSPSSSARGPRWPSGECLRSSTPLELRLLRIAYRRASGLEEMPDSEFLNELGHELKDQLASNADLREESDVFFEFQAKASRDHRDFDTRVVTTNDDDFCTEKDSPTKDRSPLARNTCRKIEAIQRDLARIGPGWFHTGGKWDVPKDACFVGRCGNSYVWVNADGREQLTELTLTVLKISSLIKETQTLINPGSVKFSPGDRGGLKAADCTLIPQLWAKASGSMSPLLQHLPIGPPWSSAGHRAVSPWYRCLSYARRYG